MARGQRLLYTTNLFPSGIVRRLKVVQDLLEPELRINRIFSEGLKPFAAEKLGSLYCAKYRQKYDEYWLHLTTGTKSRMTL